MPWLRYYLNRKSRAANVTSGLSWLAPISGVLILVAGIYMTAIAWSVSTHQAESDDFGDLAAGIADARRSGRSDDAPLGPEGTERCATSERGRHPLALKRQRVSSRASSIQADPQPIIICLNRHAKQVVSCRSSLPFILPQRYKPRPSFVFRGHFNKLVSGYWLGRDSMALVRRPRELSQDAAGR